MSILWLQQDFHRRVCGLNGIPWSLWSLWSLWSGQPGRQQAVRAWVEPVPCLTVMSQGKGLLGGAGAGTGAGITHNHNQPTLHSTAYMENIENLNYLDVIER